MFENYRQKVATGRFSVEGDQRNRFSQLSDMGEEPDDDFQSVPRRRNKRQRRSTGNTSGTLLTPKHAGLYSDISKDDFRALPTDDKLVTLFELMNNVGIQSARLSTLEKTVDTLNKNTSLSESRLKLLEYKSIDSEVRSRRNNLIFRGIEEARDQGIENCIDLVTSVIWDKLDMGTNICIQRAHRLGRPIFRGFRNIPGQSTGNPPKPRPIIVCFRDYQDIENILSQAYKLKGTSLSIHKDYPKEIVNARSQLWPKFKAEKLRNPRAKVSIGFPAKLTINGKVIENKFPDWYTVLRGSRVEHTEKEVQQVQHNPLNLSIQDPGNSNTLPSSDTDESIRDISMQMDSAALSDEVRLNNQPTTAAPAPEIKPPEPASTDAVSHSSVGSKENNFYDKAMERLSQLPVNKDEAQQPSVNPSTSRQDPEPSEPDK